MDEKLKHADITDKILKAFFTRVYRRLVYGFLEKVYVKALVIELRRMGLKVEEQVRILVLLRWHCRWRVLRRSGSGGSGDRRVQSDQTDR